MTNRVKWYAAIEIEVSDNIDQEGVRHIISRDLRHASVKCLSTKRCPYEWYVNIPANNSDMLHKVTHHITCRLPEGHTGSHQGKRFTHDAR